jgi:dUTP pyrophosphatase|tara:strand:- start:1925 stop:2365 length:441 start_codon:yes stop_codon:yes gene_type:complete
MANSHKIQVKVIQSGGGILPPIYKGDVGFNLMTCQDIEVPSFGNKPINVPIGIKIKLPKGMWAEIRPRSSSITKFGVFVYHSIMDEGYIGEWFVICASMNNHPVFISKGTCLAQCILHNSIVPEMVDVKELPETERGTKRFGSSGK